MRVLAVGALALWAAQAPLALGADEREPNDTFAAADLWPQERAADTSLSFSPLRGTCDSTADYTSFRAMNAFGYRLDFELRYDSGDAADSTLSLLAPGAVEFRRVKAEGSGHIEFAAASSGTYAVGVVCDGGAERWALNLSYGAPNVLMEGPSESEHNDRASMATSVAGNSSRGAMDEAADPLDLWRLPANSIDVIVALTAEPPLQAHLASVGADGAVIAHAGQNFIVRDVAENGGAFGVVATSGAGYYNLTILPAPPRGSAHAGASETGPNDRLEDATPVRVSPGLQIQGDAHLSDDPVDWYKVDVPYPTRTNVTIESTWGCGATTCEAFRLYAWNLSDVIDPYGDPLDGAGGYFLSALEGTVLYLRVDAGFPGGAYTVHFDAPAYPLLWGAVVEVVDGNASGTLAAVAVSNGTELPLRTVNLALGGYGTMYGQCMNLVVLNRAPVGITVELRAGTRWRPEDSSLGSYVTTRTVRIEVEPWTVDHVAFDAAMETSAGLVPDFGFYYFLSGRAEGTEGAVANATADGTYGPQAEVVALWAAAGMGRAELKQWGAGDASITEAATILNSAGLQTSINPPPRPPPPPPTGLAAVPAGILVGLALLGLIGIGVAVRRASHQRNLPPLTIPTVPTGAPPLPPPNGAQAPSPVAWPPAPPRPPQAQAYPGLYAASPASAPSLYAVPERPAPVARVVGPSAPVAPRAGIACPKCSKVSLAGSPYCVYCGEFFVK